MFGHVIRGFSRDYLHGDGGPEAGSAAVVSLAPISRLSPPNGPA